MPFCHAELKTEKPKPSRYPKTLNTLGDHIRKRRLDLGLFQSAVARQIDVALTTVTNWEGNKSQPELRYMPAILRFLGYRPFSLPSELGERIAAIRKMMGMSQRMLAQSFGVDPGTLQGWEAGDHKPTGRNAEQVKQFLSASGFENTEIGDFTN